MYCVHFNFLLQITSYGLELTYSIHYEVDGRANQPSGPDVIMAVCESPSLYDTYSDILSNSIV